MSPLAPLLFAAVALDAGRAPLVAPRPADAGPSERAPLTAAKPADRFAGAAVVYPFNGHDLTGWEPLAVPPWSLDGPRGANLWVVGVCAPKPDDPGRLVVGAVDAGDPPELVCPGRGADLATVEDYGDFEARLEYLLPEGSNAGVIPHGRYELQLLDDAHGQARSQAKQLKNAGGGYHANGHLSAYGFAAPDALPELPAGRWHALSFRFLAPRFGPDGAKTANARFERVTVDGVEVLGRAELPGSTGKRARGAETPTGPFVLQGDHGPVAFRNLRLRVAR